MDTDAALAALEDGLDALFATGFESPDTASAARRGGIRHLERVVRRAQAAQVEQLAAIDRQGLHRHDGHPSAKVMVRHVAQLSDAEANRRAQTAALLGDLPDAAAAYRAGELGTCQVRRLGRLHANRRVRELLPCSEAHFLTWAADEPYRSFDSMVDGWERRVDQDGAADRERRNDAARDARWLQDYDGSWTFTATSPSLAGAQIVDIVSHFLRLEWEEDWAEARARLGDAATGSDLRRTETQRRHDAFHRMCLQAASTAPGGTAPVIVTNLVMDHETFEREARRLAGVDPRPVDPHDPGFRCSTLDGAPLDPTAAILAALFGEVRRVVVGSDSVVIDLGRRRLLTGAAALAARLGNGECMWSGCHVPVTDCQIDHLRPWPDGGPSNPANAAPLCGRHNRLKHTQGWCTWRDTDGRWRLRRPDGTTVEGPHGAPGARGSPLFDHHDPPTTGHRAVTHHRWTAEAS